MKIKENKTTVETKIYPKGTVTKTGKRKWTVYAPDGRPTDSYSTKKQAIEKAQHWNKWDTLGLLTDIMAILFPSTMPLLKKMFIGQEVTKEEKEKAMTKDVLLQTITFLAIGYPEIFEDKEKVEKLKEELKEILEKAGLA